MGIELEVEVPLRTVWTINQENRLLYTEKICDYE